VVEAARALVFKLRMHASSNQCSRADNFANTEQEPHKLLHFCLKTHKPHVFAERRAMCILKFVKFCLIIHYKL
jgi:hypothetical protein